MKVLVMIAVLVFAIGAEAFGQQPPEKYQAPGYQTQAPIAVIPTLSGKTTEEIYLSIGVLVFGLIILGFEMAVMFKVGKGWGTNSIRVVGITLVIVAGLYLITAGYSETQIAPIIGLLGTITGYLLGKTESDAKK